MFSGRVATSRDVDVPEITQTQSRRTFFQAKTRTNIPTIGKGTSGDPGNARESNKRSGRSEKN